MRQISRAREENRWNGYKKYLLEELFNPKPNMLSDQTISIVKDKEGRDLDAVEVVVRYLGGLPQRTTAPKTGRLKLIQPMPAASFGSPEIQPWRGATLPTTPPYTGAVKQPARNPQSTK